MRSRTFTLVVRRGGVALGCWVISAVAALHDANAAGAAAEVDPGTRKELSGAEDRLDRAIQKRDLTALLDLLADYYADSYHGSTKAVTKSGTLARAKGGMLFSYPIGKDLHVSSSAGTYTVEGEAKAKPDMISDQETEVKWIRVRRLWVKKDGHWRLVSQELTKTDTKNEKHPPTE